MPNLSIMVKPASSLCNLRCKYCFYHSLSAERENYSYGIMQSDTAENLINKALSYADGGMVYFAFQGGEPLLAGIEYFHHFIEYTRKCNIKNSVVNFSIQTNGTLLNEEWAKLFLEHKFLVGLSLDGNRNHNKFRLDAELKPVHARVMEATRMLEKYKVDFNILIVATGNTADHIKEIYRYLKGQGFKYLQFIPCLRGFGDKTESELYMTPKQYEVFLIELFKAYVKDYVAHNYTSVRWCDNMVNMYNGKRSEQCGLMGHCTTQYVIEGNGNVYPCDFYCTDECLLGNVNDESFEQLSKSDRAKDFIMESLVYPDKCKGCNIFGLCHAGGCKRNREDRDYCDAYRAFYKKCLPLFRVFSGER